MSPVLPRHQEQGEWPPLSEALPITFPNGSHVDSLTMVCPDCRRQVPEKHIPASISIFPADVVSIQARTYCATCHKTLINNFRIRAAGHSFQLEEIHEGFVRVYHLPTRFSILKSIWAALNRLRAQL